jgi:hypothetical protein
MSNSGTNKIRITKRYKDWSPKAGIEEVDTVEISGGSEGSAMFVTKVNATEKLDYEIVDYEVALISRMERPEIIKNPSGGGTGKLMVKGKDF